LWIVDICGRDSFPDVIFFNGAAVMLYIHFNRKIYYLFFWEELGQNIGAADSGDAVPQNVAAVLFNLIL